MRLCESVVTPITTYHFKKFWKKRRSIALVKLAMAKMQLDQSGRLLLYVMG